MATVPADMEGPSDAELIESVRKGRISAYGALYERHVASAYNLARQLSRSPAESDDLVSEAFAKVLDTLRVGRGPDSAFRAYLLTSLRHTAYDKTRRDRKVELAGDVTTVSGVNAAAVREEFADSAVEGLERSLAAQAFARLPERWQAVLWHSEIEGQSPVEIAPILGLTPNSVSALAYRAREGLRQAYLQVHLAETQDRRCRAAAERLGAWTRDGLSKREKAQVEVHLDGCERCRALAAELSDVNGAMRGFVAPLVLGIGTTGYLAATGATKATTLAAAGTATAGGFGDAATAGPRQFVGIAAAGIALVLAIVVGLNSVGDDQQLPVAGPGTSQDSPSSSRPQQPPPEPDQPDAAPPAAVQPRLTDDPTPPEEPQQQPAEEEEEEEDQQTAEQQPQEQQSGPPMLYARGPSGPLSLVGGGGAVDLPLTVTNTGGTASEPVTAMLTLPAGVTASPVNGLAARPLLSFNGARAGTVNCPGGTGIVTCSNGLGLAPGESVTLLFRLAAARGSVGGLVNGSVTAGSSINVGVSVQVNVTPPPVVDGVAVSATANWRGLLWVHPVIEVLVENTGTSARPVTVRIDKPATLRRSSQDVTCTVDDGTSCTTSAELTPGEKLKLALHLDTTSLVLLTREQHVNVSATLGTASDSAQVSLRDWLCLFPPADSPPPTTAPTPPGQDPPQPPTSEHPTTAPTTGPTTGPTTAPSKPSSTAPSPTPTPTTPPTSNTPPPTTTTPPSPSDPPPSDGGGLGGLVGWLFGNG